MKILFQRKGSKVDFVDLTRRIISIDGKCGAVAVDGGHSYLRRCGKCEDWEELSEME